MASSPAASVSEQALKDFDWLDHNKDGLVSQEDLRVTLQVLDASTWTDVVVRQLFGELDLSKAGQIQSKELADWCFKNGNDSFFTDEQRVILQRQPLIQLVSIKVIDLNGEDMLDKLELVATERVAVLKTMIVDGLGGNVRVDLVVGDQRLPPNASLEECGLVSDGKVTAVLKAPVVPEVLKNGDGGVAELRSDGSVVTSGSPMFGGDSSSVEDQLKADVQSIYKTNGAFAALKDDGSVVAWGIRVLGGSTDEVQNQLRSGVASVHSAYESSSFAALKNDGSVVVWGSLGVRQSYKAVRGDLESDVQSILTNWQNYSAIKSDGRAVSFGAMVKPGLLPHEPAPIIDPEELEEMRKGFDY